MELSSIFPYVFMAWYLVKHKDSFTFTFTLSSEIKEQQEQGREFPSRYMLSIWLIYKGPEGAGIGQWYSAGLRAE
jgi:hypothetical protein